MKDFFLGMGDELLIVRENANGYATFSHLEGMQPTSLAIDFQNENLIYCGTKKHGLWKSEDGGKHWLTVGRGIDAEMITSVSINPNKQKNGHNIVYVGTEPSKLYYSENTGVTWHEFTGIQSLPSKKNWSFPPRPYTHHVRWITPSYSNEDYIGVSIEAGAFIYTKDHGKTWFDRSEDSPIDIHTLLTHPKAPDKLFATCGDGVHKKGHTFAESKDSGKTWRYISEGLQEHPYAYNMAINPYDPFEQVISAAKNAAYAHSIFEYSAVYKRQKNYIWIDISEGLPEKNSSIHNLAADPINSGIFYAMNNYGIYYLKDSTSKWKKLEVSWKEKYLDQKPTCFVVRES